MARWYGSRGYVVVDRNWRTREGELDLVVRQGRRYVFCEVKTRSSTAFGEPIEAVTHAKRQRLRHLAARWLAEAAPGPAREVRFDVASVMVARDGTAPVVEVVEGAF